MIRLLVLAALLIAIAGSASACFGGSTTKPAGHFTLAGTVHDARGTPVSGATVTAGGASTTTNASGHYTLRVASGKETLRIKAFPFADYSTGAYVTGTTTLNATLDDAGPVPLVKGSSWVYQDTDAGTVSKYGDAVTDYQTFDGHKVAVISSTDYSGGQLYGNGRLSTQYAYEQDGAYYLDMGPQVDPIDHCAPAFFPEIPAPLAIGTHSSTSGTCAGAPVTATLDVMQETLISVPAGTFDAFDIAALFSFIPDAQHIYVVPGVGIVETTTGGANPTTDKLVSYSLR